MKDEYIAAQSEENYSTFRAIFMTDSRLAGVEESITADFMVGMWKDYDFVPKPKEGDAFMPCTKDREAEKDRRRRARKVRDANDMDAAGSDNTARAPATKRESTAESSGGLKKGGTEPTTWETTNTEVVLVLSPQQQAAAQVEEVEKRRLLKQKEEAAAAAAAAAKAAAEAAAAATEAAATAATTAAAAQLDLNNSAGYFAYT